MSRRAKSPAPAPRLSTPGQRKAAADALAKRSEDDAIEATRKAQMSSLRSAGGGMVALGLSAGLMGKLTLLAPVSMALTEAAHGLKEICTPGADWKSRIARTLALSKTLSIYGGASGIMYWATLHSALCMQLGATGVALLAASWAPKESYQYIEPVLGHVQPTLAAITGHVENLLRLQNDMVQPASSTAPLAIGSGHGVQIEELGAASSAPPGNEEVLDITDE